jgi:hypothetical protein
MENGVTATTPVPPAVFSASQERVLVLLLGCVAAVHVLFFSAAFPFFNNVDEQAHFDLAVKYSEGHIPRALETVSTNATPYVIVYGSLEYLMASTNFSIEQFPPPWTQPMEKIGSKLLAWEASWNQVTNHEASQPPLYYALTGAAWRAGTALGLHDGFLLYWLRFLNGFIVAGLVWLGFAVARMIFPDNPFLKLGVPALLAFFPQSAFYSIENDALSPLAYGAAFVLLMKWLRADVPGVRLGAATGLALAATFLTKISNVPLLAVSTAAVFFKVWNLVKAGNLRASGPALASLSLCAGLPMIAWLAWCKHNFGDLTGAGANAHFAGLTVKPFSEWWHHPIFTPPGLWTFIFGLTATFWRGEILWHWVPLALPLVDWFYVISSIILVLVALVALLPRFKLASGWQRQALALCFLNVAAAVTFLGFLSVIFDFHNNINPSREHPYFTLGRLMLGALIPFLLLYLYGLDRVLNRMSLRAKFLVLALLILFMLVSEITADWPVFFSQYNWFHM